MTSEANPYDIRNLLTPRWIITTLLVVAAVAVMARLGIWQLDRLAQRRALNAKVEAQISAPPLVLSDALAHGLPPNDLLQMEYRQVRLTGTYDPANQIVLRNQVSGNLPGYHLITPLKLQGVSQSVLVDRGFIPLSDKTPADWAKYDQPGPVTVSGVIRLGHVPQFFGVADPALAPGQTRLDVWTNLNLPRIQSQTPYPLLPVTVQAAPASSTIPPTGGSGDPATAPVYPIAALDQPDLSEGPHMGYAIQWFAFAATLALGYPYFVRKQLRDQARSGR